MSTFLRKTSSAVHLQQEKAVIVIFSQIFSILRSTINKLFNDKKHGRIPKKRVNSHKNTEKHENSCDFDKIYDCFSLLGNSQSRSCPLKRVVRLPTPLFWYQNKHWFCANALTFAIPVLVISAKKSAYPPPL